MKSFAWFFNLNPFSHLAVSYQEILFFPGTRSAICSGCSLLGAASVVVFLARLLGVRSAARFVRGGRVTPRPRSSSTNVTKIYRRYGGRHFATLKSALLQRSILHDLQAERDVSRR